MRFTLPSVKSCCATKAQCKALGKANRRANQDVSDKQVPLIRRAIKSA